MTIDFTKLEGLDEETQAALGVVLANEAFTGYVAQSVENRENAIRESAETLVKEAKEKTDEFRTTNIELKKKLDAKDAIDPEEYGRLVALGSTQKEAADKLKNMEIEHGAIVDGLQRKLKDYEVQFAEVEKKQERLEISSFADQALRDWDAKNPQLRVREGASKVLVDDILSSYKKMDGSVVMQVDGKDYTNDRGFGTIFDYVEDICRKKYPFCFTEIAGGGASGSNGSGVTKSFKESNEAERSKYFEANGVDKFNSWMKEG